jgi:hypothetical protein
MSQGLEHATRRKAMRVATALTGMTGLAGGAVLAATPADAGANGQHVQVCGAHPGWWVSVKGPNQSGNFTSTRIRKVVAADGCYTFTAYWFKGDTTAYGVSSMGFFTYSATRNVPRNMTGDVYKITLPT